MGVGEVDKVGVVEGGDLKIGTAQTVTLLSLVRVLQGAAVCL